MAAKRFWRCPVCGQWNSVLRLLCLTHMCHSKKQDATEDE